MHDARHEGKKKWKSGASHLGLRRNVTPVLVVELKAPGLNPAEEPRLVLVVEWRVPAEQRVDDYAHAPHVYRLAEQRFVGEKNAEAGRGVDRSGNEYGTSWRRGLRKKKRRSGEERLTREVRCEAGGSLGDTARMTERREFRGGVKWAKHDPARLRSLHSPSRRARPLKSPGPRIPVTRTAP